MFGKVIRDLRKRMKLSQKELAEGICTQAQISKLENGSEMPSSITLYHIARKLNVKMDYFFDTTSNPRIDYVSEIIDLIRKDIGNRNYPNVMETINKEKDTPYFSKDIISKQFLIWHEGICDYYLLNDSEQSINKLMIALKLTGDINNPLREREIEIVNSIAIIYNEINRFDESVKYYNIALASLKKLPTLNDYKIYIRVLYGLSKSLKSLKRYKESIDACRKGIARCKKAETYYLYGELEYQMGKNYLLEGRKNLALKHFKIALLIFELEKRYDFIEHVNNEISRI